MNEQQNKRSKQDRELCEEDDPEGKELGSSNEKETCKRLQSTLIHIKKKKTFTQCCHMIIVKTTSLRQLREREQYVVINYEGEIYPGVFLPLC